MIFRLCYRVIPTGICQLVMQTTDKLCSKSMKICEFKKGVTCNFLTAGIFIWRNRNIYPQITISQAINYIVNSCQYLLAAGCSPIISA